MQPQALKINIYSRLGCKDEFGSATTKKLAIPRAIDEYNYRMGQVDRGDQFRAGNPGLRRIRRGGWHAL